MAEREVESPSSGLTGHVIYFRTPHDVSTELISLHFWDLTGSTVTCNKLECIVKVTFSSNAALKKAAEKASHTISDGCVLTSMTTLIPSSTESDAFRSNDAANSAMAIEPTQAKAKASITLPDPPNLTSDSGEECGSGLVQTGNPIAVVTLDVDCQVHVTQYCINELQDQVNDLKCVVKPLGVGMLLLEDQGRVESDRGIFQQAAARIFQYVDKFATLVIAIPDQAANENLRKFLERPGNVHVSCCSIARCTSGWLYKVTCDKKLLSKVQAFLGGAIQILHCSTRAATGSDTGAHNPTGPYEPTVPIVQTGPYVPTEPHMEAGQVGTCRLVVSAHIIAMQLFNRHFVTHFEQAVRASAGSLPLEVLATVTCEASGFMVQGSKASVTVAAHMLRDFLTRVLTEERWLKTDSDNRTLLLQRLAAVEDATRTTIVVLDEQLDGADSESSHQGGQILAATTASDEADRGGAGEFEAGGIPSGRRLQLQLVRGSLAEQTDDVLVNSVGCALRLSQGAISSSILKKAGNSMQEEIYKLEPHGISQYALVVTGAHRLSCKRVFHVACGVYDGKESEEKFSGIISRCLRLADEDNMKSIAFPAIGAGILKFPPEKVITILHAAVSRFSARNLQSVKCVVFDSDCHEIFNSTLARLLKANSSNGSEVSAKAGIPPVGRFHLSVVIGTLVTERSNLIVHATDKYLTLQDITGKNIEGAMDKVMKDELQTLRANGPRKSKTIRLKNCLTTGSQLMLLNTSEISSLEQWSSVITSAFLYADQMKYQSLSVSVMEEGEWNIDKCIPTFLEALATYECSSSIIPTLKQVHIVVNAERSRLTVQTQIQKFLEGRNKGFLGTVASRIGKWVLPSAEKESGATKSRSCCILHIVVSGTDKASIHDACRRLVDGVKPELWQWQGRPSAAVPQAYAGSYHARQDSNQHESRLTNARGPTDKAPRPDQEKLEFFGKGTESSRLRHKEEQHALTAPSEYQYSKLTAGASPPNYPNFSSEEAEDLRRDENDRSFLQGVPKGHENLLLQQHDGPRASKDERALPEGVLTGVHDNTRGSNRELDLPERPQVDSSSADASSRERLQQGKQHRAMHENEQNRGEKTATTKPTSEQIGGAAHAEAKQQAQLLQHPNLRGTSALEECGRKEVESCSYDHCLNSAYEQHGDALESHPTLPSEKRHTAMHVGKVQADRRPLTSTNNMQQPLKSHDAEIQRTADDQRDSVQEFQTQNRSRSDHPLHPPPNRLPYSSDDQRQPQQSQVLSDSQPTVEQEAFGVETSGHRGHQERLSEHQKPLAEPDLSQKVVVESENLNSLPNFYAHDDSRGSLQDHQHRSLDRSHLDKEPRQMPKADFGEQRNQQQPIEYHLMQRSNAHQQQQQLSSLYFEEHTSQQQQLGDHRISREKRERGEQMAGGQQDDQQQVEHSQLVMKRNASHETPVEGVIEIELSEKKATVEVHQTQKLLMQLPEEQQTTHRQGSSLQSQPEVHQTQKQLTQLPEEQHKTHQQGSSLQSQPELDDLRRLWNVQKEEQALSSRQDRQSSASSGGSNQLAVFAMTELSCDDVKLTHLTKGRAAPRRRHPYRRSAIAGNNAGDRYIRQASASQHSAVTGTLKCKQCGEESDFAEDAVCCPDCGASLIEQ